MCNLIKILSLFIIIFVSCQNQKSKTSNGETGAFDIPEPLFDSTLNVGDFLFVSQIDIEKKNDFSVPVYTLRDVPESNPDKNKIVRFLNGFKEKLLPHAFHFEGLAKRDLVLTVYAYCTESRDITLAFLFFNSHKNAMEEFNADCTNPEISWQYGVKNTVIYYVDGENKEKVDSILSILNLL